MKIIKWVDRHPKIELIYGYDNQEVLINEKGRDVYFIAKEKIK